MKGLTKIKEENGIAYYKNLTDKEIIIPITIKKKMTEEKIIPIPFDCGWIHYHNCTGKDCEGKPVGHATLLKIKYEHKSWYLDSTWLNEVSD